MISTYIEPNHARVGCELHGLAVDDALENKIYKVCRWPMLGHNQITLKFPPLFICDVIALLLNDHVVQDHTSSHGIRALLHVLEGCQTITQIKIGGH
jgi:hypothetical protein